MRTGNAASLTTDISVSTNAHQDHLPIKRLVHLLFAGQLERKQINGFSENNLWRIVYLATATPLANFHLVAMDNGNATPAQLEDVLSSVQEERK